MKNRFAQTRLHLAVLGACILAVPLAAQDTSVAQPDGTPLSVIDWLGTQSTEPLIPKVHPPLDEPPIARSGAAPPVTVSPLGRGSPREIGLVPATITGLPPDIWAGSDIDTLTRLLEELPDLHLPAGQALLYTVLLADAQAPGSQASHGDELALARVRTLMARGALAPAQSLIEQAGVTTSAAHFDLWMQISLLTGEEDRACRVLGLNPHLSRSYGARILCDTRAGRWEDAALTFGSAQALDLLPTGTLKLFDRYLHPEAFDGARPLPPPRAPTPLDFRLFESIGEPQPTRNLPRAFAVADLRDLAGWKAQLEAAERLTRAGALPDNHLLGLYTDRRPAASGGVWDRVRTLQRFETALNTNSPVAVSKTLPSVWVEMQDAGLEASFATLFSDRLSGFALTGRAAGIAFDVSLLSANYEAIAADRIRHPRPARPLDSLLIATARGTSTPNRPDDVMATAVHDAFSNAQPRQSLVMAARDRRLGESILRVLALLHDGSQGDAAALRDALATLRALGLEDTARRAALQVLLLEG